MPDVLLDLQTRVKEAIADIDQQQVQLRSVLAALNGGSFARTSPKRGRGPKRSRKSGRAGRGRRQEQFLAAVREHPGASVTEVAKQLGVERTSLYPVAKRLHSTKQITKKGSGYSAKD